MIGNLKIHTCTITLAVLLLSLSCCKRNARYVERPLYSLSSYLDFETSDDAITLKVKKLSERECVQLFGKRGRRLLTRQKTIYPIQLSITNHSDALFVLKPHNVELKLADYCKVASRLQINTTLQVFGAVTTGAVITALVAAGGVSAIVFGAMIPFPPLVFLGAATCVSTPFMLLIGTPIATTVHGIETAKSNTCIREDVKRKSFRNTLIIEPKKTIDTIIFVEKKDYKSQFTITFTNQDNPKDKASFLIELDNK